MEKVYRQIIFDTIENLEPLNPTLGLSGETVNRLSSFKDNKVLDDVTDVSYNNYRSFPCDIVISALDSLYKFDTIGLVTGIVKTDDNKTFVDTPNDKKIMRYANMMYLYNKLNEFINECVFYKLCKREKRDEYIWVEGKSDKKLHFFSGRYKLVDLLPENTEEYAKKGLRYICVNSNLEWFNKSFVKGNINYSQQFFNFVKSVLSGEKNNETNLSIPYVNLPICLTRTNKDMGMEQPMIEEWKPNKIYTENSFVRYRDENDPIGHIYRLTNTTETREFEISANLYNNICTLDEFKDKLKMLSVFNGLTHYALNVGIYKGYFNKKTGIAEFDEKNLDGSYKHWSLCEFYSDLNSGYTESKAFNEQNVTDFTNSRLKSVMRPKRSFDNDGKQLPFYATTNGNSELEYVIGNMAFNFNDNGECFCNSLDKITLRNSDNPEEFISLDSASTMSTFSTDLIGIEKYNMIDFEYQIDKKYELVDNNLTPVESSELKYKESHPFTINEYVCNIGDIKMWRMIDNTNEGVLLAEAIVGSKYRLKDSDVLINAAYGDKVKLIGEDITGTDAEGNTFVKFQHMKTYEFVSVVKHFNINYFVSQLYDDASKRYIDMENGFAHVTYKAGEIDNKPSYVPTYFDETSMAIQDVIKMINVEINRFNEGIGAYERHNILTEINTFQDLETYRNDYFKLKSQIVKQ